MPSAGYIGDDEFSFTASDYDGTASSAAITLSVAAPPPRPPDTGSDPGEGPAAAGGQSPSRPATGPIDMPRQRSPARPLRSRRGSLNAVVAGMPSTRRCVSRGRPWAVRFGKPSNTDIARVEMSVNGGRPVSTSVANLARARSWKVLRGRSVRVTVRVYFDSRGEITGSRTYRFCRRGS
jgi:hypothetical protein